MTTGAPGSSGSALGTAASLRGSPWVTGAFGLVLGTSLSLIGFSDWGEVHRMFTLVDARLFLTLFGAGLVAGLGFAAVHRIRPITVSFYWPMLLGSALFGVGWALTGSCPAVVLVQLGEGKLSALFSLAGVVIGAAVCPPVARRFGWTTGSCGG